MAFIPNTLSNLPVTSGQIFFVSSTGNRETGGRASDANAGRDPSVPMATIDAAVARCKANSGDMIVVMPGHAETVGASDITLDVAGVSVVGLGTGASRPTITFSATGSTIAMSAASCSVSNILISLDSAASATTVTDAFTISGASCTVEDCEITPHATSQFTNFLSSTTGATSLTLRNNRFVGLMSGASGTSGLVLVGCTDLNMVGNTIMGYFSTGAVTQTTTALRVTISNNTVVNTQAYAIDLADATTGVCAYNNLAGSAWATTFDVGDTYTVENYVDDVADHTVTGAVFPTTGAS